MVIRKTVLRGTNRNGILVGSAGDDRLLGELGGDWFKGGKGNDQYWIDDRRDRITETAQQGTDKVYSAISWKLGTHVENLNLTGRRNINGTGNTRNNIIKGNYANNTLNGSAGNDVLKGGGGNDTLQGSNFSAVGEIDILSGGRGADRFILGTAATVLYDDGNATTDGIKDYALITDFNAAEDVIQLSGSRAEYLLAATTAGLPTGTAIYRVKTGASNELIGIVRGVSGLSLTLPYFSFTATDPPVSLPENQPPVLDLNGMANGVNYAASFTEDGGAGVIVDRNSLTLTDDASSLTGATIILTNPLDGTAEVLSVDTSGTTITAHYTNGILTLSGTSSVATYQQVLRSLTYLNTSQNPNLANRQITLTVSDGKANSGVATTTVTINSVNDVPTVLNPIADQQAIEDSPFSIQLPANTFNDVEGGTLTYTASLANGGALPAWLGFNAATLTFSGTPLTGDVGTLSIQVTAGDSQGSTVSDTFTLAIAGVNEIPIANSDFSEMVMNSSTTFNVVNNDTDSDGTIVPTSVVITVAPMHGNVTNNGDGTVTYTPNISYVGADSFTYTVNDDAGATSNPAIVNLTIKATEIRGTSWDDQNRNGVKDAGEVGIAGHTIYLDQNNNSRLDTGELSTTTDNNGNYIFTGLTAGTYTIAEVRRRNRRPTYPATTSEGSGTGTNILVSTNDTIQEYTLAGALVGSAIGVPYPTGSRPVTEDARDIITDSNGHIYAYNGTFDPYLSIYTPDNSTWAHQTYAGWSTAGNGSHGGIATHQNYVYATDYNTANDAPNGIVRFNLNDSTATRFGTGKDFIDLTLGLDGLLYGLEYYSSGSGKVVHAYDPLTGSLLWTTTLANNEVRGIAVNKTGDIFAASWDDRIYHFDNDGSLLNSVASGSSDLYDIDVSFDGKLVVGSRFGTIIATNESLSNLTSFTVSSGAGTFVSFKNYQEPTVLSTLTHTVNLSAGQTILGVDFGSVAI